MTRIGVALTVERCWIRFCRAVANLLQKGH